MIYEYLLISVVIACGYWGWFFVRRQPNGTPMFGVMQLGAAALAGLGLLGRWKVDAEWLGVAGAIGIGACVCMLVIGPMLRWGARRLAAVERFGAAGRLLDIAEILAPGSGVAEEKAVLGAMAEIRDGRIEQTVDALAAAKERVGAEARFAIDERIALLYLAAHRWGEAISHAEAHLFGEIPDGADRVDGEEAASPGPAPAPASTAASPASPSGPRSLRETLGLAPPVWVELLGAYGRTGDMDRAATMLSKLEDVCAGRDDAAMWIHRGRLMFLALAGRTASVRALIEPRRSRHMSAAARTYWMAVAHEHEGDRAAATEAYERARARTRGRPRELIDQALARLADPAWAQRQHGEDGAQLSPIASEVVARVEAAPMPAPVRLPRRHRPWATWTLSAAVLGAAGAIAAAVGPSADLGVLVRSGAMVRSLVEGGEWWRIVACVFVHIGAVHLFVNALGLFVLGRVTEELYGGARTLALFGASGLAGSLASYLAGPAGVSAGASGAVFGLLGAVFVELTLHREHYRAAWRRGLWGAVVVVAIGQVGVGFLYPVIDQWAHGAGLAGGVAMGALLSPRARWAAVARHGGRALAVGFAAASIAAAVLVARTSIADSYGAIPRARRVIDQVALDVPATWHTAGFAVDPESLIEVRARLVGLANLEQQAAAWVADTTAAAKKHAERVEAPVERAIALPEGWHGGEVIAVFEDPMGSGQRILIVAAARAFGGRVALVSIALPETMARMAPSLVTDILASAGPV